MTIGSARDVGNLCSAEGVRRAQIAARKCWSRNTTESFLLRPPESTRARLGFSPGFRARLLAELTIAAVRSRAMVRDCLGVCRVDGYVEVGSVEIIFTCYADERE